MIPQIYEHVLMAEQYCDNGRNNDMYMCLCDLLLANVPQLREYFYIYKIPVQRL